jgi:hypothetical protein
MQPSLPSQHLPPAPPAPPVYRRRRSLFGPLVLIAIGVIFLMNNLGVVTGDAWGSILAYWPVIFILIGLDNLYQGEGLAGAILGIAIGVVFLMSNLGYLNLGVWEIIIRLWPLLLIGAGLDVIIGKRSQLASLAGGVVMVGLLMAALWYIGVRAGGPASGAAVSTFAFERQTAERASLRVDVPAGSLRLRAAPGSQPLLEGNLPVDWGAYSELSADGKTAVIRVTAPRLTTWGGGDRFNSDLRIAREMPLDLQISLAAGEVKVDLTNLDIEDLRTNAAVGRTQVRLIENGRYQARLELVIGDVVVQVPEGLAVQIRYDRLLTAVRMPAGYTHQGSLYTSPGFDTAENRVELVIDQVIGMLTVLEVSAR